MSQYLSSIQSLTQTCRTARSARSGIIAPSLRPRAMTAWHLPSPPPLHWGSPDRIETPSLGQGGRVVFGGKGRNLCRSNCWTQRRWVRAGKERRGDHEKVTMMGFHDPTTPSRKKEMKPQVVHGLEAFPICKTDQKSQSRNLH